MPPSVNHLRELEYANGLHWWLPGLGTFGGRERASDTRMDCSEAKIVRLPNKAAIAENLLFCPP
jgi:hypothetical protein